MKLGRSWGVLPDLQFEASGRRAIEPQSQLADRSGRSQRWRQKFAGQVTFNRTLKLRSAQTRTNEFHWREDKSQNGNKHQSSKMKAYGSQMEQMWKS
jgi:hypothetical protein